ncbi:type II and III secretion system protein [Rhodohalobacter halophilus]|uniref:type II and III secretion system protein n=1 Tax=Rhodohalobacter halophilus TaxID=1812810 RepID=UPI001FDF0E2C|nr:type II and III secretion system protein [Rhodohalobacter halophilus]
MKSTKIAAFLMTLFIASVAVEFVSAQDRIPREYTNPDEMIAFDRRTTFPEAIDVLNQFAQDFEGKFIIDRTGYTGQIGVTLPAMHWREALDYILRVQKFVAFEEADLYEIVTQAEADAQQEVERRGTTGQQPGQQTGPAALDGIQINTGTREVRINATFFEGSKRALREIGVDWSTLTSGVPENLSDLVNQDGGGGGGSSDGQFPTSEFESSFVNINSRGAQNVSQNVFNSIVNFGEVGNSGIEVQALFSAFEADNLGQILATPSVKVMNGEPGRIQVGEDFSIKQRDFAGNVTDQFFSTGTILEVTPQIVEYADTTLIYLEIQAERSSAQPDPVSTVISKQQAETHALLLDGESTVIAGLYRTEEARVRRGIPILKDLPGWFFGLKYLFGYNSSDVIENELIILLQAELEESVPERFAKRFSSQQELVDNAQERHRNRFEYISPNSPSYGIASDNELRYSETNHAESENEVITNGLEVVEEQVELSTTPQTVDREEIDRLKAQLEARQLQEGNVNRRDLSEYKGEWREVEMENMNGDYSNLNFYVIGGSFIVKSNADRLYDRFLEQGYDAHMLFNPATDYYFVAYRGFEDPDDAISYTREIQSSVQAEAWLSRIIREERLTPGR